VFASFSPLFPWQFYFQDFFEKLFEEGRQISVEEALTNMSEENKAEGLKWLRLAATSGKRATMLHANQFLQLIGEE